MKKSLLSVVVCVAVLLSALFVMPASAASVNVLDQENMGPTGDGSFTNENGVLTFNAAAAAEEFQITMDSPATIGAMPYINLTISSDVAFDLCFRDAYTDKWIFAAGDFCYKFGENLKATDPLPAGTYTDIQLDLTGAYTWNNTPYENATLDAVMVIAKAPGKITISKLEQSDGMTTTNISSASYAENADWKTKGMLNADPSAWGSVDATSPVDGVEVTSSAVIAADGTGISVSATAGLWPAASYDYSTPYEVDWETSAIEVSYSIWSGKSSKVLLFYGNSSNANFESEEYVALSLNATPDDLTAGHYTGTIMLKDIIPESSVVDGKVKLNGIKVFAVGTDKCVTVNAMNLKYVDNSGAGAGGEDLDVITPTTPTVAPNGNNGGNGGTTTNPGTGDTSNAIVFVVVAAVAAGVVTLSVVSKKAKAN